MAAAGGRPPSDGKYWIAALAIFLKSSSSASVSPVKKGTPIARTNGIATDTIVMIAGGMKRGIASLEPASEDLRLMANLTIQIGTDKTWDQYFGRIQYTFIKREKINLLTFNLGENLVLISTEPDFDMHTAALLRDTVLTIYSTGVIPERTR